MGEDDGRGTMNIALEKGNEESISIYEGCGVGTW